MSMASELTTLLHSSLPCDASDVLHSGFIAFWADTFAHVGIAGILTTACVFRDWPVWLFWAGLALVLGKELSFDLPNSGWSAWGYFDSAWDALSWFVGFYAQWALISTWSWGREQ